MKRVLKMKALISLTIVTLLVFVYPAYSAESNLNEKELAMKIISSEQVLITHKTIEIGADFDNFTQNLEAILGKFDPSVGATLASDSKAAEEKIKKMAGEQGLMIFGSQNHGALFAMLGKKMKAKRYHIGNPLTAIQMTQHNIRAGLYAPMTVLVYEPEPLKVRIDYDLPSSEFGQFKNAHINEVASGLDLKLEKVIEKAFQLSSGEK